MGGAIEYVYRDGSRLTPWMLYVINRASAELEAKFGCALLVTSGIRTHQEQINIFLSKYRVQWFGNGPYGDVRWWNGKRYVRYVGGGTVAPPSKSNHEIQGTKAAADLRDSGRDAGVSRPGNERADWLRANAPRLGLIASGYGFGEAWHYDIPDIFRTPPPSLAGGDAKPIIIPAPEPEEEDDMNKCIIIKNVEGTVEWSIIGATVPGGHRTTRAESTAAAWALLYGDPVPVRTNADYVKARAEAIALNKSWVAQQAAIANA